MNGDCCTTYAVPTYIKRKFHTSVVGHVNTYCSSGGGSSSGFSEEGGFTLCMDVTVAANSRATTIVPMGINSASVTIAEGSTMIWKNGAYVAGGVMGVTRAVKVGDTVAIEHGSGTYSFVHAG